MSTRGMPGGRFIGEEGIPEPRVGWLRDDASVRQVRAARKRNNIRPVFCVLYEILYEQDDDELKRFLWIPPRPLSDCLSGKSTRGKSKRVC